MATALHLLGVAGYRGGFLWAALLLGAGGGTLCALLLPRRVSYRFVWAGAAAIVGVTIAGALLDAAPPSRGRLHETLDDLDLRFFTLTAQHESGHSWCQPTCPVVQRSYEAPVGASGPALLTVAAALVRAGLLDEDSPLLHAEPRDRFEVRGDELHIAVEAREPTPGERVGVTIRAEALR